MPNTAATSAPPISRSRNGRWRWLNGDAPKAYRYAPKAKNAAYPRSRTPAKPTTMFRPSASRMNTPAFTKPLIQVFWLWTKLNGGKADQMYRTTDPIAMLITIVEDRWAWAKATMRVRHSPRRLRAPFGAGTLPDLSDSTIGIAL